MKIESQKLNPSTLEQVREEAKKALRKENTAQMNSTDGANSLQIPVSNAKGYDLKLSSQNVSRATQLIAVASHTTRIEEMSEDIKRWNKEELERAHNDPDRSHLSDLL